MRILCKLLGGLAVTVALGCGGEDPNKNLKPVDPHTPRLTKPGNENPRAGNRGTAEKPPAPIIK